MEGHDQATPAAEPTAPTPKVIDVIHPPTRLMSWRPAPPSPDGAVRPAADTVRATVNTSSPKRASNGHQHRPSVFGDRPIGGTHERITHQAVPVAGYPNTFEEVWLLRRRLHELEMDLNAERRSRGEIWKALQASEARLQMTKTQSIAELRSLHELRTAYAVAEGRVAYLERESGLVAPSHPKIEPADDAARYRESLAREREALNRVSETLDHQAVLARQLEMAEMKAAAWSKRCILVEKWLQTYVPPAALKNPVLTPPELPVPVPWPEGSGPDMLPQPPQPFLPSQEYHASVLRRFDTTDARHQASQLVYHGQCGVPCFAPRSSY